MNRGIRAVLAAAVAAAFACAPDHDRTQPLRIEADPSGAGTRLTLIPSTGIRINAQLKPALELRNGEVVRFDSPHLTADSAYFAQPPTAQAPGRLRRVTGTLRASVCDDDAPVCRSVTLEL